MRPTSRAKTLAFATLMALMVNAAFINESMAALINRT